MLVDKLMRFKFQLSSNVIKAQFAKVWKAFVSFESALHSYVGSMT